MISLRAGDLVPHAPARVRRPLRARARPQAAERRLRRVDPADSAQLVRARARVRVRVRVRVRGGVRVGVGVRVRVRVRVTVRVRVRVTSWVRMFLARLAYLSELRVSWLGLGG